MNGDCGAPTEAEFAAARESMAADQLERRRIRDPRVLEAMRAVPRHLFVPESERRHAYEDRALPIGEEQTISQPYMVALMTEALGLRSDARVLEIGTGSGYQAAVLARLAREVVSIERRGFLAERAREVLDRIGIANVRLIIADGTEGWPEAAPYDGIVVTAGAPWVPDTLKLQLAHGGRLVIPVGSGLHQQIVIVQREGETFVRTTGEPCVFVPLVGKHGWHKA